jgi:hypothetical protein
VLRALGVVRIALPLKSRIGGVSGNSVHLSQWSAVQVYWRMAAVTATNFMRRWFHRTEHKRAGAYYIKSDGLTKIYYSDVRLGWIVGTTRRWRLDAISQHDGSNALSAYPIGTQHHTPHEKRESGIDGGHPQCSML